MAFNGLTSIFIKIPQTKNTDLHSIDTFLCKMKRILAQLSHKAERINA